MASGIGNLGEAGVCVCGKLKLANGVHQVKIASKLDCFSNFSSIRIISKIFFNLFNSSFELKVNLRLDF